MLAGLVSQLVMDGVIAQSRHKADSIKKEWGYIALAVISGVIALSFLTASLYMGLTALYTAPIAALFTGLVISLVSLGCLVLANRTEKRAKIQGWMQQELDGTQLTRKMEDLLGEIEEPIRENPATALLLATLAGFLTADRIH